MILVKIGKARLTYFRKRKDTSMCVQEISNPQRDPKFECNNGNGNSYILNIYLQALTKTVRYFTNHLNMKLFFLIFNYLPLNLQFFHLFLNVHDWYDAVCELQGWCTDERDEISEKDYTLYLSVNSSPTWEETSEMQVGLHNRTNTRCTSLEICCQTCDQRI